MSSMTLDPSTALADKYRGNRQMLEAAVLGRSSDPSIDPYSALRALQKLNVADRYEQMQKAMQGQPNPPSIAQQTIAQATAARAPQPPVARAPAAPPSGGLGGMPVPEETFNMAGGGLVAFAAGDEVDIDSDELNTTTPTPEGLARLALARRALEDIRTTEAPSPEEAQGGIRTTMATLKDVMGGGDYYGDTRKQLEAMEAERTESLGRQKGLAALQAAAALSQGSDLVRGLGAAGAAFGETYGRALSDAEKEKRALINTQIQLADTQRKENLGLYKTAADIEAARAASATEAKKLMIDALKAEAAMVRAGRVPAGRGPTDRMRTLDRNFQVIRQELIDAGPRENESQEAFMKRVNQQAEKQALSITAEQFTGATESELDIARARELSHVIAEVRKSGAYLAASDEKQRAMEDAEIARVNEIFGSASLPKGFTLD